jgi:hypothetical protein
MNLKASTALSLTGLASIPLGNILWRGAPVEKANEKMQGLSRLPHFQKIWKL